MERKRDQKRLPTSSRQYDSLQRRHEIVAVTRNSQDRTEPDPIGDRKIRHRAVKDQPLPRKRELLSMKIVWIGTPACWAMSAKPPLNGPTPSPLVRVPSGKDQQLASVAQLTNSFANKMDRRVVADISGQPRAHA